MLKSQRTQSTMEFLHNVLMLRKEIMALLLRDFGVKSRIREHLTNVRIDNQSQKELEDLRNKYNMNPEDSQIMDSVIQNAVYDKKVLDAYPEWIINYCRESILHVMENMCNNVYYANSIYISEKNPEIEYGQRRYYLNLAIGNCFQLSNWLDFVRQTFPVDANKYIRYLEMIEKEIALLKGVRLADNKRLKSVQKEKERKEKNLKT